MVARRPPHPRKHLHGLCFVRFFSTMHDCLVHIFKLQHHSYTQQHTQQVRGANLSRKQNMGSQPEEYRTLLLGLDSHAHIPDLSSAAIEDFLGNKPVAVRWWPRLVGWESRLLWLLSGASILVSMFNYLLSFVTLMFTGHLGALELAGASIASVGIQGLAYGIMVLVNFCSLLLC